MTQLIVVSLTSVKTSVKLPPKSPMDKFTSRQILVSTLVGVLCLYVLNLFWDNRDLSKKNARLLESSQTIQKALESVDSKYQTLLRSAEGAEKEKQAARETIESLKKQNETLAFQVKKIESQFNSIKEEKNYLEEMLINKTKQIDILKSQKNESAAAGDESAPGQIRTAIQGKEDELRRLNEQNKVLQEKLDRLFRTTNEKINEINVAKIALAETVSTAQKGIQDEWNTVNLGSVTTNLPPGQAGARPAFQNQIEEIPTPHEPKTEGHVLAINNEHGFVVIDIGKVDNLPIDAMLEVKKNGVAIATLSVLETRDAMAACNIRDVQDGQQIEINDLVSILR